ncbi:hypothetical protein AK830_g1370 [Neonectria ditissima]|uniref:Uncharacterized protein n=1 Tax=Neonectria ditissima TaxID=78410 RepID=A0A0P7BZH3_9HYPO|nr:hypothetical protein AK830_g1370 [Neonectria ditissima]
MGGHHCGGCRKAMTTRCVAKAHMVQCPVHGDWHLPRGRCAACHDADERVEKQRKLDARQARKQKQDLEQKLKHHKRK